MPAIGSHPLAHSPKTGIQGYSMRAILYGVRAATLATSN